MIFRQIAVGSMQNFSYLIGDNDTKEAVIVDCGFDVDEILNITKEEKLKIKKIILTHYHYDHVQKAGEMAQKTDADIYFHEDDAISLKKVVGNSKIKLLKDNDEIKIGKIIIKVIHTPGHSPGSVCLLFENKLITADTLFVNAIGRTDLPGGNAPQLFDSLQKLKKLDDKIEVYPGHDYGDVPYSTIGREKKNNPYFACKTKEDFLKLVGY